MSHFDDDEERITMMGRNVPSHLYRRETVRCAFCQTICTWSHTGERWRMIGPDGKFHICHAGSERGPASPDEFEDAT